MYAFNSYLHSIQHIFIYQSLVDVVDKMDKKMYIYSIHILATGQQVDKMIEVEMITRSIKWTKMYMVYRSTKSEKKTLPTLKHKSYESCQLCRPLHKQTK